MFGVVSLTMGNSALPFVNGLARKPGSLGQLLLRKALFPAQLTNGFSQCHLYALLFWFQYPTAGQNAPERPLCKPVNSGLHF